MMKKRKQVDGKITVTRIVPRIGDFVLALANRDIKNKAAPCYYYKSVQRSIIVVMIKSYYLAKEIDFG